MNPGHVESRRNLGSVLAQLNDPKGAQEQLQKAIDLGDEDPAVRFELAAVLRTLGENQEAENQLKIYKQEAQEKSDLTQAYAKSDFADQKLAAGDTQQAIALYREALAANPRDASLAYKLAMAFEKTGDTQNERAALEQAVQIDPQLAEAQNQLGYLASREGNTASAEEHFRVGGARFSRLCQGLGESGGDVVLGIQNARGEGSSRTRATARSRQSSGAEIEECFGFRATGKTIARQPRWRKT